MSAADEIPPEEHELEQLLRRLPAEPVDPAARARARAAFLAGAATEGASRAGAPERTGRTMDATSEQAFERWLARALAPEPARAEARARARAVFLSSLSGLPGVGGPRPVASRRRRVLALALAAAGVLAVTFLMPETPRWRVQLFSPVAFDDEEFRLVDEDRLATTLERSGRLVSREAPVRLALSDALELELRPGTTLLVPALPELDGGTPILFELEAGECLLRTRPGWRGNPLLVRTAFGDVRATGTAFGVLALPECVCVCVVEGAVEVDSGAAVERVEANSSLQLFRRGDPAPQRAPFSTDPASPESAHQAPLQAFGSED